MPIKLKINKNDTDSLCYTCRNAQVMRGQTLDREIVLCDEIIYGGMAGQRVPFKISECNKYADSNHPSKHDMEQVAWILKTDKGRRIGFQPPPKKGDDD